MSGTNLGGDHQCDTQDSSFFTATPAAPTPYRQLTAAFTGGEDEWEYEYSTTETDTYYLTLDLTIPEFARSRRPVQRKPSRNTQTVRWINPSHQRKRGGSRGLHNSRHLAMKEADQEMEEAAFTPPAAQGGGEEEGEGDKDNDNDNEDEEDDEDQDIMNSDVLKKSSSKDSVDEETAESIQILELESENPIVSYKGHTFSMTWTDNLGTELLFMKRDEDKPLPTLRSLPDEVDLLAANSARLVSKELKLTAKTHSRGSDGVADNYQPKDEHGKTLSLPVKIDLAKDTTAEKKSQASFLERLIAIKASKGEKDDVSVYTTKRQTQRGWHQIIKAQKYAELDELRALLLAKTKTIKNLSAVEYRDLAALKARVQSLEENLTMWDAADKSKRVEDKVRKRRRPAFDREDVDGGGMRSTKKAFVFKRRARGSATLEWAARTFLDPSTGEALGKTISGGMRMGIGHGTRSEMISTSTPRTWDELGAEVEEEAEEDEHGGDDGMEGVES